MSIGTELTGLWIEWGSIHWTHYSLGLHGRACRVWAWLGIVQELLLEIMTLWNHLRLGMRVLNVLRLILNLRVGLAWHKSGLILNIDRLILDIYRRLILGI